MKFIGLLILVSCAHSFHQGATDMSLVTPGTAKEPLIKATGKQFVILGVTTETNYVDEAKLDLERQCSGVISPLTTRYFTDLGFLSWTNRVELEGVCSK